MVRNGIEAMVAADNIDETKPKKPAWEKLFIAQLTYAEFVRKINYKYNAGRCAELSLQGHGDNFDCPFRTNPSTPPSAVPTKSTT